MKQELIKILEKIDKAENTSKEILPLLYELCLLMRKNKEKFKRLFVYANGFEELMNRTFEKTRKYIFSEEWIDYEKTRDLKMKNEKHTRN